MTNYPNGEPGPNGGPTSGNQSGNDAGFGGQEPSSPSPGQPLPQFNASQPPTYSYDAPGVALVNGTGKAKVFSSFGKAFSIFGQSPGAWIGITALLVLSGFVGQIVSSIFGSMMGAAPAMDSMGALDASAASTPLLPTVIAGVVSSAIVSVMMLYTYNGALQVVEGRKLTFNKFFVLKHGFVTPYIVLLLAQIFTSIIFSVAVDSALPLLMRFDDTTSILNGLLILGIGCLVALFVTPLIMLSAFYPLDHGCSVGEAFARCFADSGHNYFRLFGLMFLAFFIVLIGFVLVFVGLLVAVPIMTIMYALVYRQISRGQHVKVG